jgi:hypothetical protein
VLLHVHGTLHWPSILKWGGRVGWEVGKEEGSGRHAGDKHD